MNAMTPLKGHSASPDLRQLILDILDENHLAGVAVNRPDGWPHVSLVNYLRHGHALYFVIARSSQKFENISRDSRIGLAIGGTGDAARGLSMAARAAEVLEPYRIDEINQAIGRLPPDRAFTPHPSSVNVAVMEARPQIISVIDYSHPPGRRELVKVVEEWRVEPLGAGGG